ncbi:MAG: HD-GYP domain-containing protein [Clostridiales bacterium]|nr:HD-GYP domain-containing protein [Clostridiales bacterium]
MTRRARIYIAIVSALGMLAMVVCCWKYFVSLQGIPFRVYGWQLLFLIGLCALCRSFPITIRKDQGLDLSVLAILSAFMMHGTAMAMVVYAVSSLITFERQSDGTVHSIYNISPVKTFFNTANIMIAILVPGLICRLLPWQPGDLSFPMVLLPTLVFSLLAFFLNYLILLLMFYLNGDMGLREAFKILLGLSTNVIAAMPLGLIIALVLAQPMGGWLTLILICPLMLARYAWKLYLDTSRHKDELITAFISAIEARDAYTQGHSTRVADYTEKIARQMGMKDKDIALLREGALLHDIGKIGVSDQILHKNGPLSAEEWVVMKQHPTIGTEIVAKVGLDERVVEIIQSHHERYDGSGYPNGKPIGECSLATRIMGVADAFDAMTSERPYRKGIPVDMAIEELCKGSGTQFDPAVVEVMVKLIREDAI